MDQQCPMKPGENLLDDPVAWGRELIRTHDHDPLYTGLWRYIQAGGQERRDWVRRYMLAYWCCYSVGASAFLASRTSAVSFWDWLDVAAENGDATGPAALKVAPAERWPRAAERRHWRGQKCVDSVAWLRERFPRPEDAVMSLEDLPGQINLRSVELEVTSWPQFGPWIAFKAADMLDRVLGVPVDFPTTITSMYRDPRKGAEMAGPLLGDLSPQGVTEHLLRAYAGQDAPPAGDRPVNVQEVETVLCKWKSARNGHYWIGKDTAHHREELELWGGHELLSCYPTPAA